MSTDDGLHVPLILLVDIAGNAGTLVPEQIVRDVPKLKVGVSIGLIVTVNEAEIAHCPAAGVKIYVSEAILSIVEGLQLPVIPFIAKTKCWCYVWINRYTV